MSNNLLLSSLLKIFENLNVQIASPKIVGIEKAQLAEVVKLADTIIIQIHDTRDGQKPTALIRSQNVNSNVSDNTFYLEAIQDNKTQDGKLLEPELKTRLAYLGLGRHYVVNQAELWNDNEPLELGQIKIVPTEVGHNTRIRSLDAREREFVTRLNKNGTLTVSIWEDSKPRTIRFVKSSKEHLSVGASTFDFQVHSPRRLATFNEYPDLALSFCAGLVENVLIIKRSHTIAKTEYYILVTRKLHDSRKGEHHV
jgi:hypothetical protein